MSYVTLGFSIASFLAAGLLAISSSASGGLQRDGDPISRAVPPGVCAGATSQGCQPALR
jgi:hypothetical protein